MKNLNKTWIVIANSASAHIYQIETDLDRMAERKARELPNGSEKKFKFKLQHELAHEKSCLKKQDINADKSGNNQNSTLGGSGVMEHTDPHRIEQIHFSKTLSDFLKKEFDQHHYEQLVICSEPRFYGLLKKSLPTDITKLIIQAIQKDYIPLKSGELKSVLETICENISH